MIRRIVEIASPAYLHLRQRQLIIERDGHEDGSIPIEDLGVLILDHQGIVVSQAVLGECFQANAVVVLSNCRHIPNAMLLPLEGHSLHSRVLREQVKASEPCRKRLWQQLVRAKIDAQARVLYSVTGSDAPLPQYARRVRSGDPENLEAQAARIYWPRLFGKAFRRDANADGINALLNYGYAVLRAAVARAICGAGLHPAIGIQHRNQYNSFGLADDVMEPLRPLIDLRVSELYAERPDKPELDQQAKRQLLEVLNWPLHYGETKYPLMVALHYFSTSVRRCLGGAEKTVTVPQP